MNFRIVVVLVCTVSLSLVVRGDVVATNPRVVKISFDPKGEKFTMQVNREPLVNGKTNEFTAAVEKLSLGGKDLVLFDHGTNYHSIPENLWRRLYSLCVSNRVAFYSWPADRDPIFTVAVYHWVTPYETPDDLESAGFFLEGKPFGKGKQGFMAMVEDMKQHRSRPMFLGGCHVKDERLSGLAVPYHNYWDVFHQVYRGGFLMDLTSFE